MSRLLFAAARGARIEYPNLNGAFFGIENIQRGAVGYRIHPYDEHMQYGPISTALREVNAAGIYGWPDAFFDFGKFACDTSDALAYSYCTDELHRSLFLLILAEALADEGQ